MREKLFILPALILALGAFNNAKAQESVQERVARQRAAMERAEQPRQAAQTAREEMTPEKSAETITKRLSEQLNLSDKQYKKVYNLYLARAKKMSEGNSADQRGENMQRMGGPGGMGGSGGMGGGMRGSGGPGGFGGGQGGMRGGQQGMGGGSPRMREGSQEMTPRGERPAMVQEDEKDIASRDKKMKKILDSDQYSKWSAMEREMIMRQAQMQQNRQRGLESEQPARENRAMPARRIENMQE